MFVCPSLVLYLLVSIFFKKKSETLKPVDVGLFGLLFLFFRFQFFFGLMTGPEMEAFL